MRSGNPVLNDKTFSQPSTLGGYDSASGERMTLTGTVNKCFIMFAILLLTASYTWNGFYEAMANPNSDAMASVMPLMLIGIIGGLVVALVTVFKATWSPYTAPLYAALEGLALGGISAMFEMQFPGIVIQAVGLTLLTLFSLLAAYRSGLIKATENFKLGIVAATGGIFLLYMVNFVMGFFGASIGFIHDSGPIGIGFSLVVVTIAALNLVLDFDFIEHGAEVGAPKYMEWYGAFGLTVTLVWLYLEILRLLSKLRR
ncbi:MAG: Bax inhibitor-1/YccA family protein [Gammaproteobacteria bacterium]|nr:Bax inhibitor-1/YccA family protein [Gammaproteobacteria bacterium]